MRIFFISGTGGIGTAHVATFFKGGCVLVVLVLEYKALATRAYLRIE